MHGRKPEDNQTVLYTYCPYLRATGGNRRLCGILASTLVETMNTDKDKTSRAYTVLLPNELHTALMRMGKQGYNVSQVVRNLLYKMLREEGRI